MKKQFIIGALLLSTVSAPATLNAESVSAGTCKDLGHVTVVGDADYLTKYDRDNDGVGCESYSTTSEVAAAKERAKQYYANQESTTEETTVAPKEETTVTPKQETTVAPKADTTEKTTVAPKENTTKTYTMEDTASSASFMGLVKSFLFNLFN